MAERLADVPARARSWFPQVVLPLHIFEPRYRVLMFDCIRARTPSPSSASC